MIRRVILSLLLFLLPFQLGYHFWPEYSYVLGFRLDYLSPTIYFIDIVTILYLCFSINQISKILQRNKYWLSTYLLFLLINILISSSFSLSVISWVKTSLYLLFCISLTYEADLIKLAKLPIIISTSLVLFIEFGQLINQASLGGFTYFLGERHFTLSTPNIAKLDTSWGLILRPYSTFSHPNSLAGYLLLIIFLSPLLPLPKWLKIFSSIGVIFTFSKIAVLALIFLVFFKKKSKVAIFVSIIISFVVLFPLSQLAPEYISTRYNLGSLANHLLSDNWFFGVGLNNYINVVSQYISPNNLSFSILQPVHSLPLLMISEIGLLGTLLFLYFYKKTKIQTQAFTILTAIILITGSVDHYWWTLPQNRLILILAIAITFNRDVRKNSSN